MVRGGLLLGGLTGDEEPPDGDEDTDAGADAEGAGGADLVEDSASREPTDKKRDNADDLVFARDDAPLEGEQPRVRHELTPHGRQHDYATH